MGKITEFGSGDADNHEPLGLDQNQQVKLIFIVLMAINALPMLGLAAYIVIVIGTILTSALFFQCKLNSLIPVFNYFLFSFFHFYWSHFYRTILRRSHILGSHHQWNFNWYLKFC